MRVLGLAFSGHGSSMCLVEDGRIAGAVNLERLTRVKFSLCSIPALREVTGALAMTYADLERVPTVFDFYDAFPQMLEHVTGERELAKAGIDLVMRGPDTIVRAPGWEAPYDEFMRYFSGVATRFDVEHHLGHAYQAYLCSPFDDAAILTVDGAGETLERHGGHAISATLARGEGNRVEVLAETNSLLSIGAIYTRVTRYLGFREEQEGNTMALASFGSDRFYRQIRDTLHLDDDGTYRLDVEGAANNFVWATRMKAFCPKRSRDEPLTQDHMDLAWGCQALAEDVLLHLAGSLQRRTGKRRLAMAGGVALNCVANARILRETPFEEIYVMPNAGDRGLAAGNALYGYHVVLQGKERQPPLHDYLGRSYSDAEISSELEKAQNIRFRRSADIAAECAKLVAGGRIVGWVQGGAEFGPRALGHRSLIADPRTLASKERLDREIKRREWFRPYAPSVLAERADEYFEMLGASPYMLQAVPARPLARERTPGIVHSDGSVRVQTVERAVEPRYHRLISKFEELTGVPVVLNTSFNGYGEPMVETATDAVKALESMRFDALCVGDFLVWRGDEPEPDATGT
jgi:carbamoyltransferase